MTTPIEEWLRNEEQVGVSRVVSPQATGVLQVHRSIEFFGNKGSVGFRAPATSSGPLYVLPASDSQMGTAALMTDATGNLAWMKAPVISSLVFDFDGGGSDLTVDSIKYLRVPWAFTIREMSILAKEAGTLQFGVWARDAASHPPNSSHKITASAPPTLAGFAVFKPQDQLTGWSLAFASNISMAVNVDVASGVTYAVFQLTVEKQDFIDGLVPTGTGGNGYVKGSPAIQAGDNNATPIGGRPTGGDFGGPWVCPP